MKKKTKREHVDHCPICGGNYGDKDESIASLRRAVNTLLTQVSILEDQLVQQERKQLSIGLWNPHADPF